MPRFATAWAGTTLLGLAVAFSTAARAQLDDQWAELRLSAAVDQLRVLDPLDVTLTLTNRGKEAVACSPERTEGVQLAISLDQSHWWLPDQDFGSPPAAAGVSPAAPLQPGESRTRRVILLADRLAPQPLFLLAQAGRYYIKAVHTFRLGERGLRRQWESNVVALDVSAEPSPDLEARRLWQLPLVAEAVQGVRPGASFLPTAGDLAQLVRDHPRSHQAEVVRRLFAASPVPRRLFPEDTRLDRLVVLDTLNSTLGEVLRRLGELGNVQLRVAPELAGQIAGIQSRRARPLREALETFERGGKPAAWVKVGDGYELRPVAPQPVAP